MTPIEFMNATGNMFGKMLYEFTVSTIHMAGQQDYELGSGGRSIDRPSLTTMPAADHYRD